MCRPTFRKQFSFLLYIHWVKVDGCTGKVRVQATSMSMDPFDLNSFWQYLSEILRQIDRHRSTDNIGLAKQLLIRAEDCQSVLRAVLGRVTPIAAGSQLVQDFELLLSVLGDHCNHISEWTLRQDSVHPRLAGGMCPVT